MRAYSPYPTLTNLRSSTALAQAQLGDAMSQKLATSYRQIAAELGLALPDRPAGLSNAAQMVWDILEAVDVASAQLSDIATRLFNMFVKGGAVCEDLLEYNGLAVSVYDLQRGMLAELRRDGVQGLPLNPPLPPLFQGYGILSPTHADRPWEINCDPDSKVVGWVSKDNPNGVGLAPPSACPPCNGGELQGAFTVAVVGGLALGAFLGTMAHLFKASVDKENLRQQGKQIVTSLEFLRYLEELQEQRADKCRADGKGTYAQCLEAAEASLPTPDQIADIIEEVKKNRKGKGRTWLWWLGVGTVIALGVGAIIWWKRGKSSGSAVTIVDKG